MPEYLTIYDSQGRDTGFVEKRDGRVFAGAYYLVVHIFTRDEAGNFLVTRRSPDKPFFPLCWEVSGGCVQAGEPSALAARRELTEETGLEPSSLVCLGRCTCPTFEGGAWFLVDVYQARVPGRTPPLVMQEGEVCEYRWVRPRELARLTETVPMEPLTPYTWRVFRDKLLQNEQYQEETT